MTYVAIGASDAVGVGANDPATETWPVVLDTLLPSGSKLVNLGVPGITLARALDVELPVALDALPSRPIARNVASGRGVVTVWLAVNDLRGVSLEVAAGDIYS